MTSKLYSCAPYNLQHLLPIGSSRGLLGAELTCRWTATEVGAMLKEACRAILAFLKSWPAIGCVAPGRLTAATFTVLPSGDKSEMDKDWVTVAWQQ